MVFLYFLLALYFATDKTAADGSLVLPSASALLQFDARVMLSIFILYLLWDVVSEGMAKSGKYFTAKAGSPGAPVDVVLVARRYRTVITLVATATAAAIWVVAELVEPEGDAAGAGIIALIVLAVGYRFVKDGLKEVS